MKNEIIAELRRIRDSRAKHYHYNVEAMTRDLMKLEPWMERKTVVMRKGRIVPLTSVRRSKRGAPGKTRVTKQK